MNGVDVVSLGYDEANHQDWVSHRSDVVLFIGENGAGKSRLLREIAMRATHSSKSLILIANTAFDRFADIKGDRVRKLRVRGGALVAERILKRAIIDAVGQYQARLRRITMVLEHCKYGPLFGFSVTRPVEPNTRWEVDDGIEESERREIESLVPMLLGNAFPDGKIFIVDFEESLSALNRWGVMPLLIKHEAALKRMGVISDIKLYFSRRKEMIPLRWASSGELSLISTMAFLAVNLSSDAIVLIDEPENSLHPRWQQQYLELVLHYAEYEGAKIRIATHSPLIVASTVSERGRVRPLTVSLMSAARSVTERRRTPVGVDGVLTEAFNTVTPESHYLSVAITELLESLASGAISVEVVNARIDELLKASRDERQKEALRAARDIAKEIEERSK